MVVLGLTSLTFENLDEYTWLVVSVGGEGLGLLGGDGSVSWDKNSHDTTGGLNTLGKRGNIEKEEILDGLVTLTTEDSSLDGSTVSNSLIGVDGSVESLTVEVFRKHVLDLGDTGGSSDEDNFVNLTLTNIGILKDVLDGRHTFSEKINAKLLEFGTGDGAVVILTFSKGLALNLSLMCR
mmetsp:Transcript_38719/g.28068  ORF Transcript_38719/g.28068 Transcript_38719/m.28068 type:complete len:180 (+) Transcript_38719:654-1193(+)